MTGSAQSARLSVRDLAVRRDGRPVLDGLSFDVAPGEIFGILGPNGAGKTTAFLVLTGILKPTAGSIALDGEPFGPEERHLTGIVFQDPALDPRLTVVENLVLAARLYGVGKHTARERAANLLERLGLSDRVGDRVDTLSGGMRRRVELARALVHEPSLLVLDEPTTGFDEVAFRATWDYLHALRGERGITMLLTTHRPEEAERCDRLGILDRGRIIACDTPQNLRERVRGDLLVLEAEDGAAVAATLRDRFGIDAHVIDGRVLLEQDRGHELVPRIVETFPEGTLRSVSMRRAGLGEVFLELTGRDLDDEARA